VAIESTNACDSFDPDRLVLKLKVTLAADRNAIDPVVQGIMDVVRNMQCATGKEDAIELALSEALSNARPGFRSRFHSQPRGRREHLLQSWPRYFPHQPTDGRGTFPQQRQRDSHAQTVGAAAGA
jgi:hypothetical protein